MTGRGRGSKTVALARGRAGARALRDARHRRSQGAARSTLALRLSTERRSLRAAETPDRIAWHLSREIERALADVGDDERAQVGLKVARALLSRLGDLVEVDRTAMPVDPAVVLHAILRRRPDGSPDVIVEPL